MSFYQQYESIRQGLRGGETHASFASRASKTVVSAAATDLSIYFKYNPEIGTLNSSLDESRHRYFLPIGAHLQLGMLTNALSDSDQSTVLWNHISTAPSNLAKSELPNLIKASQIVTKMNHREIIQKAPLSWLVKFTQDSLDINPNVDLSTKPDLIKSVGLEKMQGYGPKYIESMVDTLDRVEANTGRWTVDSEGADRVLKAALVLPNMLWQLRQVFKYLKDTISEPTDKSKLQNIQLASYLDMITNVFDSKKSISPEYALAWTIFTVIQDLHESTDLSAV